MKLHELSGRSHRQRSQTEDDADHDVHDQEDVLHDDGEAGLRTRGGRRQRHIQAPENNWIYRFSSFTCLCSDFLF